MDNTNAVMYQRRYTYTILQLEVQSTWYTFNSTRKYEQYCIVHKIYTKGYTWAVYKQYNSKIKLKSKYRESRKVSNAH